MQITNTSRALQGVHSTSGLVFIEAGKTMDVDVHPDYVERVKSLPFLSLDGAKPSGKDIATLQLNVDSAGIQKAMDDLRSTYEGEIKALKDRIAELELQNEELTKRIPAAVVPEAKHRGAGSYSIMEGEIELREKLTKNEAEAFNKLDAEGRAKWLTDNPKPAA